jgi:hypothetical protein
MHVPNQTRQLTISAQTARKALGNITQTAVYLTQFTPRQPADRICTLGCKHLSAEPFLAPELQNPRVKGDRR